MRIELPSGTAAELVHPPSGPAGRGLVVIPDVMGMRPLFDDLVAHLAAETTWSVAAFELYPGREHLEVADRLAAASPLADSVFLDVTGRTAKRLLELAGEDDEFSLPITQEELAGMVGASRERVNKAIASFIRLEWIEQIDRTYRITNREQLTIRSR